MVGPAKMRVLGQSIHAGGGHDSDIAKAADVINSAGGGRRGLPIAATTACRVWG